MDSSILFSFDSFVALTTLTTLEIVLGIDNIVFLAVLTERLPEEHRRSTRTTGLILAMIMRILLLLTIFWVMRLTEPLFEVPFLTEAVGEEINAPLSISGRDLILVLGGLFLLAKATFEIHHLMEEPDKKNERQRKIASVGNVLAQIAILDLVFSLDSVITAVGMADRIEVMITAIVIAIMVMIAFAEAVSNFIARHPSMKTLALTFLVMIGVLLIADGLGQHLPRGYVYFAMAFSLTVEIINLRAGARRRTLEPIG